MGQITRNFGDLTLFLGQQGKFNQTKMYIFTKKGLRI